MDNNQGPRRDRESKDAGSRDTTPPPSKGMPKTPEDNLRAMWRDLVQKVRVHEMVKCLQAEKKKLKILQANIEPNTEFLEFATQQHAAKVIAHHKSTASESAADKDDHLGQPSSDENRKTSISDKDQKLRDSQSQMNAKRASENSEKRTWSKSEGLGSASTRATHYTHARNAAELISNKHSISDQEFEDIVELCEDKIEQKALRQAYEEKKAREKYLHNADERRIMLYNFINSRFFNNFMLVTIITSIVGIFLLTFEMIAIRYAWPLIILDSCIIGIFLVEAIVKVTIYKEDYFKQLWNILDMLIIIVNFVEVAVDLITRTLALSTDINANVGFKFLKSLRALRLLRVIKFLPNLQVIVTTVFQSMLSIGSIAVLMLLFIFVFAVMGRGLFYERLPDKFGNLWLSFVTLFQLLTLDDWFKLLGGETGDMVDEFESDEEPDYVGYWLMFGYLFAYLVIEFFVFLNLFVAVLVDNFQLSLADVEIQKQREALEELEAQRKFEDMKKEGVDPNVTEDEHQRHLKELEHFGLQVGDYFPVDQDTPEAELLSEFYKDLNSLDFERFLWKRRQTMFNMVVDTALNSRQNAYVLPQDNKDDMSDEEIPAPISRQGSTLVDRSKSVGQKPSEELPVSAGHSVVYRNSLHRDQHRTSYIKWGKKPSE